MQICAVIPAYNPGDVVKEVVEKTLQYVNHLILVDDGCDKKNAELLQSCSQNPKVTLLTHPKNEGKGFALQTAFHHYLSRKEPYLVMLDSDGQHEPNEINCFQQLCQKQKPDFVMGVREEIEKMPLKSKIGNIGMSKLFFLATGKHLKDTQSGFRLLSRNFVGLFLEKCKPGRYETEMKMLFLAAKSNSKIEQLPISTTYIDNNSNSKFRPFVDSIRVLTTFAKFSGVSFASFLIDFLIYLILLSLQVNYLYAHITSRSISGIFNFTVNKRLVFKNKDSILRTGTRYLMAVLLSLSLSAAMLWLMVTPWGWPESWSKIVAELLTFVFNFFVVKHFVFRATDVD